MRQPLLGFGSGDWKFWAKRETASGSHVIRPIGRAAFLLISIGLRGGRIHQNREKRYKATQSCDDEAAYATKADQKEPNK